MVFLVVGADAVAGDHDEVYEAGEIPAAFTSDEAQARTIVFAGDIMTWERTASLIRSEGSDYPFEATRAIIQSADFAVGNLEGPIAVEAEKEADEYCYKVPPFTLAGVRDAGFDLLSLANNHVMDCGEEGLAETLAGLRRAELRSFGAGRDLAAAAAPAVADVGGVRVAFVSAICAETYLEAARDAEVPGKYDRNVRLMRSRIGARSDHPGTIVATPETVAQLVRNASRHADLVVAYLHFGVRYRRTPTPRQRALAHAAISAGADLVVGHHAHIWQPTEVFEGVPIVYGLGNFAFGSANRNADEGLLVRATVTKQGVSGLELFPLYTKNRDPNVNYQSKILQGAAARDVVTRLAALSAPLGARVAFSEGRGVLLGVQPRTTAPSERIAAFR
jgi:poly-gamma-glutamate capsule biosynthesis protein CapA/YwtB (metallophosphatase superfamily)